MCHGRQLFYIRSCERSTAPREIARGKSFGEDAAPRADLLGHQRVPAADDIRHAGGQPNPPDHGGSEAVATSVVRQD